MDRQWLVHCRFCENRILNSSFFVDKEISVEKRNLPFMHNRSAYLVPLRSFS